MMKWFERALLDVCAWVERHNPPTRGEPLTSGPIVVFELECGHAVWARPNGAPGAPFMSDVKVLPCQEPSCDRRLRRVRRLMKGEVA